MSHKIFILVSRASKATSAAPGPAATDAVGDRDRNDTNFMRWACSILTVFELVGFQHPKAAEKLLKQLMTLGCLRYFYSCSIFMYFLHSDPMILTEESDMPLPGQAFA